MSVTSNKTKDWLKNQLVTHGVPLPSASAKKEEYQRLYEERVLPQQSNAEFSSDDDTEPVLEVPQPRANSVAKNTKSDSKKDSMILEKREAWILGMSDKNLFDALQANGKSTGPIVDSTRELYQKMLLNVLAEDEMKALENIENYLGDNKEAREEWIATGLALDGFNGVSNGNTENGYSDDTDEDEAIETASRASRSSRASSKRATPTPVKQDPMPSTPKSPAESRRYSRRPSGSVRSGPTYNDSAMEINESGVTASLRSESLLFSRVANPVGRTPYKPLSTTKSVLFNRQDTEETDEPDVAVPRNSNSSWKRNLMIFIAFIIVPLLAFVVYSQFPKWKNGLDDGAEDELDVLLKSLDQPTDGVQDAGM